MIAGDHHDSNAGRTASGDRFLGFLPRRIIHSRQPNEHEIVLDVLSGEVGGRSVVQVAIGRAEHAQGLLRHRGVVRYDLSAILVRHGADAGAGVEFGAAL